MSKESWGDDQAPTMPRVLAVLLLQNKACDYSIASEHVRFCEQTQTASITRMGVSHKVTFFDCLEEMAKQALSQTTIIMGGWKPEKHV